MNSFSGLLNRVHWTRFVSVETKFKELGLLKTPVAHPTQKFPYTFKNIQWLNSLSLSVSLSLSDSPQSQSLSHSRSHSLTLLRRRRYCRCRRSVSVAVAVASSPSPLPSLSLACRRSYKPKLLKTASSPLHLNSTPSLLFLTLYVLFLFFFF